MFSPKDSEHTFIEKEVHYIFDVQLQFPEDPEHTCHKTRLKILLVSNSPAESLPISKISTYTVKITMPNCVLNKDRVI